MLSRWAWVWLVTAVICGRVDAEPWVRHEFDQPHMGASCQLIFYAQDEAAARLAADAAFARIKQIDRRLSDYRPDSELSALIRTAGSDRAVAVGDDLWKVLERGQQMARLTDGAFDVTVGPYVKLWRRARREGALPTRSQLDQASTAVGHRRLQLDRCQQTATLSEEGMRLDLGGIAKGYAADEALDALKKAGFSRALVNTGGDIVLGDPPPGKRGWRIGVAPLDADAAPSRYYLLSRMAVATSGDAYQFVVIDGRRYSHLIDPRTGLGLTTRSSVTVFAQDGMTADAMASAVSVLGSKSGLAIIESMPGAATIVVKSHDGQTKLFESRRVKDLQRLD